MAGVKRQRLAADAWRELMAKFSGSGLSVREFCRREGISTSSFNWWRSRFNGSSGALSSATPSWLAAGEFVDLGTLRARAASPSERFELRLDLGGGVILHLVRG